MSRRTPRPAWHTARCQTNHFRRSAIDRVPIVIVGDWCERQFKVVPVTQVNDRRGEGKQSGVYHRLNEVTSAGCVAARCRGNGPAANTRGVKGQTHQESRHPSVRSNTPSLPRAPQPARLLGTALYEHLDESPANEPGSASDHADSWHRWVIALGRLALHGREVRRELAQRHAFGAAIPCFQRIFLFK